MPTDQTPFADLPAVLVDEVLGKTSTVAQELLASFQEIQKSRKTLRKELKKSGLVIPESSLGFPPLPTTCATDGSYAIERLLATDLAAAAAVAVEGLAPPTEKRHWDFPRHKSFIAAEPHSADETATVLRSVMLGEELRLITDAPHDLLMLDGTFTLPIIYFNQALNTAPKAPQLQCARRFLDDCISYLDAYLTTLRSDRSDKNFIALPKYSSRREIGKKLSWPEAYDDRGMLSMLLKSGELTKPRPLEHPKNNEGKITWHLNVRQLPDAIKHQAKNVADEIIAALYPLRVFYYKPHEWLPALRVEIPANIAENTHRLAIVVQGLKHQTATPSMLEPYPVYLADRTVKALARSLPAFRQVVTQQMSEKYNGDVGDVFLATHGYRSEIGGG